MNIQEINCKLQSYKNDFYNRKEIELLNNTDNGKYSDTINNITNLPLLGLIMMMLLFFIFMFSFGSILSLYDNFITLYPNTFLCITASLALGSSFSATIFLSKLYYKRFLKNITKNKEKLSSFLIAAHNNELNKTIVPDDIHEFLKLELSDEDYVSLRNKGLTYLNVNTITRDKIEKFMNYEKEQFFLNEKRHVSLTQKDINNINNYNVSVTQ